jgi:hypothetical protein
MIVGNCFNCCHKRALTCEVFETNALTFASSRTIGAYGPHFCNECEFAASNTGKINSSCHLFVLLSYWPLSVLWHSKCYSSNLLRKQCCNFWQRTFADFLFLVYGRNICMCYVLSLIIGLIVNKIRHAIVEFLLLL